MRPKIQLARTYVVSIALGAAALAISMSAQAQTSSYVNLQNRWKPDQYIHIEHGQIESGQIQPGQWSAQWVKHPIPGTSYFWLQNRWKQDQFIHIERGRIESGRIAAGWWSAHWQEVIPAAPAPAPSVAWKVGAGIYDITGPAADRGMVGYGKEEQTIQGIHTRLWSRAFVVEDTSSNTVVDFVSADLQSIATSAHQGVMKKIAADCSLAALSENNVMLTATHVHVGPGGYDHNVLLNMTARGYDPAHYNTIIEGIYQSIKQAYGNRTPGTIKIAEGRLTDASINRNPSVYDQNPDAGTYRLHHKRHWKNGANQSIIAYSDTSRTFTVTPWRLESRPSGANTTEDYLAMSLTC